MTSNNKPTTTTTKTKKKKTKDHGCTAGMTPLVDFDEPGPYDVVCARGKHIRDSVG